MSQTWFITCPHCFREIEVEITIHVNWYSDFVEITDCPYCEKEMPQSVIDALAEDISDPD